MTLKQKLKRDAQLAQRAKRGDQKAKAELLGYYDHFAIGKAAKYHHPLLTFEDLVQEARLGLLVAIERWDASLGHQFITYAGSWCQHQLSRAVQIADGLPSTTLRRARKTSEQPGSKKVLAAARAWLQRPRQLDTPMQFGMEKHTLHERIADPAERVDERLERESDDARVRRVVALLDPFKRHIIERRYLSDNIETLRQIGDDVGLSRERIRQIEVEALKQLAEWLNEEVA